MTQEQLKQTAFEALLHAEGDITLMEDSGLSTNFVRDTLLTAKRYYIGMDATDLRNDLENTNGQEADYIRSLIQIFMDTPSYELRRRDYAKTIELTDTIDKTRQRAFDIHDTMPMLVNKEKLYESNGANVSEASAMMSEAMTELGAERYGNAESMMHQAETMLDASMKAAERQSTLDYLKKSFIQRYWPYLLALIILVAVSAKPALNKTRKALAKSKLKNLKQEEATINRLMKTLQEERFKEASISELEYKVRLERYRKKMADIKTEVPVLESKIRQLNHEQKRSEE